MCFRDTNSGLVCFPLAECSLAALHSQLLCKEKTMFFKEKSSTTLKIKKQKCFLLRPVITRLFHTIHHAHWCLNAKKRKHLRRAPNPFCFWEVFPNAALCTTSFYGHVWFLSNLRGHGNAADESQRMKCVFMVRPLPWLGFIMLMYLTWLYVDLISLLKQCLFSDQHFTATEFLH